MSLFFKMLSRMIIAFLPRSKHLLIHGCSHHLQWFWSPPKIKSVTVSIVSPSICHEVVGPDAMTLMLSFKPAFSLSSFTFIKRLLSSSSVYRKMQESGLTEIIPTYLSYRLSGFWVFTSWISSGLTLVSGCSLMATREELFFLSWIPSRLTSSLPVVAAITDDSDTLCLLMWQEIFHSWPKHQQSS